MPLFSIVVDIAARTASIEEGIARVERSLTNFGSTVKTIGEALSVGAFAAFAEHLIDSASALDTAARTAGITTKAFQELTYAAKQSGVETGGLEQAIVRMSRAISLAASGGKQQNDTLRALGISIKDLQGLAPDKQFEKLADQINKLPTAADKARAEIVLFGRAGYEMAALIAKGAAGIEELRKQAEDLGGVLSEETIKNLDEAHKAIDRLELSFSNLASTLLGKVAKGFSGFLDDITKVLAGDKGDKASTFKIDKITEQLRILKDHPVIGNLIGVGSSKTDLLQQLFNEQEKQLNALSPIPRKEGPNAPGFPGPSPLEEFHPNLLKKDNVGVDQFDRTLQEQTQGMEAAITQKYIHDILAIQEITGKDPSKGGITQEEANRRAQDAKDKFDTAFDQIKFQDVALTRLFPVTELHKAIDSFTQSMQQAFQATANESGNFGKNLLFNILKALENQAIFDAIAEIGTALHDALVSATDTTGETGQGGFSGAVLAGIGGLFGARAGGGMVSGGQTYLVGEKGPELFTPGSSGYVTANGAGGGMMFAPTYNIVAPNGDQQLRAALPGLLRATAAKTKQDMLEAFRRNNLRAPSRA